MLVVERACARDAHVEATLNHPFPAQALDGMRQRALANCDALLATDAPLLHAPSVLAVAALCRAASISAPLSAADLDGSLRDLFDDALLNDAYALAATLPDPDAAPAEDDTAELKKVRKRVKKFALWRDADKKPKRPRDDSSSGTAPPAKKAKAQHWQLGGLPRRLRG